MNENEPAWTSDLLATPHDVADKRLRVRRMFNRIAPRYELINTLFSAGRDAFWRRKAVELAAVCRDDEVLDVACGTGDLAREFVSGGARLVIGCDFAHDMLTLAADRDPGRKSARRGAAVHGRHSWQYEIRRLHWCEADALSLPFRSGSLSITSCAFGVRNFEDLDAGLAEMYRVLRPGGRAVILEFTRPQSRLARSAYEVYFTRLMPLAATLISGDRSGAYRYLPRSVVSFLNAEQMCARLRGAGFACATATPLTMGIVTVYVAKRD